MTEEEAYSVPFLQRKATWYGPGDKVTVGPAWRMDNRYYADGWEGPYTVIKLARDGYYYLAKGDVEDVSKCVPEFYIQVRNTRLTKRQ